MDVVIIIAVAAVILMAIEFLIPTGGGLAVLGALGLVAAGIVGLGEDADAYDYIAPGLITLGVLSIITFAVITPKLVRSQTDEPVRTGGEGVIGMEGDVRTALAPNGQVYVDGSLWRARREGGGELSVGSRVRVKSVDGLTLVVEPLAGE